LFVVETSMRCALRRLVCLGGLLATTLLGCGGAASSDLDVTEARAALRTLLMDTVQSVAPGVEAKVLLDRAPSRCRSGLFGQEIDTESATLFLAVVVDKGEEKAALDNVVAAWGRSGVRLYRGRIDASSPEVTGDRPGFGVRVLAVPDSGQIGLSGQTDCLEAAGG